MDTDRAFLKELHSLKDKVSESMLVGMVNHGCETLKNNPEYPKNFGEHVKIVYLVERIISILQYLDLTQTTHFRFIYNIVF